MNRRDFLKLTGVLSIAGAAISPLIFQSQSEAAVRNKLTSDNQVGCHPDSVPVVVVGLDEVGGSLVDELRINLTTVSNVYCATSQYSNRYLEMNWPGVELTVAIVGHSDTYSSKEKIETLSRNILRTNGSEHLGAVQPYLLALQVKPNLQHRFVNHLTKCITTYYQQQETWEWLMNKLALTYPYCTTSSGVRGGILN